MWVGLLNMVTTDKRSNLALPFLKNSFVMKTNVIYAASMLLVILFTSLLSQASTQHSNRSITGTPTSQLQFSLSIPEAMQSQIIRQDFENQSIFSFKNEGGKNAFLFSLNKVTTEQWMTIKSNVKNYTILENKDGFISFIEKTDQANIKGKNNAAYQQVYGQLDAIISSIKM